MKSHVHARPKHPTRSFRQMVGVLCAGKYFLCRARTLGEDSLEITAERSLSPGQMTLVNIPLSGDTLITRAKVVQSEEKGPVVNMRLEFHESDFQVRRLIRSYVANKIHF